MMAAIAEHLQQQKGDPPSPPTPPPPPLPQKLTFGIAELLPDSTSNSPPSQHHVLPPPPPFLEQVTPLTSASSPQALQQCSTHSKDQPSCSVWRPYSTQHQTNSPPLLPPTLPPPPPPLPPSYPSSSFLVGNLLDHN